MLEEKMRFVRDIEKLLENDKGNNMVDHLQYRVDFQDDHCYDEYIDVIYKNGCKKTILATGNSNGANLKAIVSEVYR